MSLDDLQAQLRGTLDQQFAALKQKYEDNVAEARQQAALEAERTAAAKVDQVRAEFDNARSEWEARMRAAAAAVAAARSEAEQQRAALEAARAEVEHHVAALVAARAEVEQHMGVATAARAQIEQQMSVATAARAEAEHRIAEAAAARAEAEQAIADAAQRADEAQQAAQADQQAAQQVITQANEAAQRAAAAEERAVAADQRTAEATQRAGEAVKRAAEMIQREREAQHQKMEQAVAQAAAAAREQTTTEVEAERQRAQAELDGLRQRLQTELAAAKQAAAAATAKAAIPAAPSVSPAALERLAAATRDIDGATTLSQALDSLLTHASAAAGRAAIFLINADRLKAWKSAGIPDVDVQTVESSIGGKDLLARAIQAGQATPSSDAVPAPPFARLAADRGGLAVPLMIGGRAVAVLYADSGSNPPPPGSSEAVEALVRHAAAIVALRTAMRTLDMLAAPPGADGGEVNDVPGARRYARLLVSEIKLYNEAAVRAGREQRDLLQRLRPEIDRAQRLYEERVPAAVGGRHVYFHQELVQTLADGDEALLGPAT